ncbi:DegT/DnrJ/EryC1/StrS aminotransferase family protein [Campylobacter canadensis]|uniref:aminotransferase class I/II-fold pyridoxal phosphate-dependent enzyme n=1 Tax=Campylobacter canadensis TaxID=449520 RepID=UPI0015546DC9|nr:DegT/DnrJ/EryC1/StrS aminotransferase family protein [Campylobacter canadensis]MBZ7994638.1 DegT/DnrJ/EryC1/StrS aminotransferase family protein [Campylobacter canadensis]MBZ8000050.1 DegT/DnrJ/EryC1/StrS aminotransferase family protein [Campylobacter canadensis]
MKEISNFVNTLSKEDKESLISYLDKDNISILTSYLQDMFKCKNIVLTNNHTAAHHLALSAIDLKRGDKILCSVNSFPNVAQSIRYFDAEPIFLDVNTSDFNIDLSYLKKTLEFKKHKKLKAIILNHSAGLASCIDEIKELCDFYNIKIINDCGFSLGIEYKNKLIGENDFISSYAFNAVSKNPLFSGGFLVINDDSVYKRAELLNNNAIIENAWGKDGNLGYFYDIVDIGYEYKMSSICAALAFIKIQKYKEEIKRRRQIAKIYNDELSNLKHIHLPIDSKEHIYSRYIIKVDKNRDNFARRLKEMNINTAINYIPINFLSYYKQKYNLKITDFPNALSNYQQILSLPIRADLSDDEVYYICKCVKELDSKWV